MRILLTVLTALAAGALPPLALAGSAEIGFLVAQGPTEVLTPESDAASEMAQRLVGARLLWPAGTGRFVDRTGQPVALDRFAAIWCHSSPHLDAAMPTGPIADGQTLSALRQFVGEGHGLLLSGTAAGLLASLEPGAVAVKPLEFGHDRGQAGLVPMQLGHPAFRDADLERGVLWMSNAVYPAFAQFHPAGSPARGILLARTPSGPENPLVEYPLGKGRVVALAWRLSPHYHIAPAALRANFERLAANLLKDLSSLPREVRAAEEQEGGRGSRRAVVPADEWRALAMAIDDLTATFGSRYPRGPEYRRQLDALKKSHDELTLPRAIHNNPREGTAALDKAVAEFRRLCSEALLANPLLDFDRLLVVRRRANKLGLPMNYESNSSLERTGYDNEIAVVSPVRPDGKLATLFRPEGGRFVGDLALHFDADRLLFSMPAEGGRWRVFEIRVENPRASLHALPLINEPDVDNYDACYLPDGRILFTSTAVFTGVPCVRGSAHVANLFLYSPLPTPLPKVPIPSGGYVMPPASRITLPKVLEPSGGKELEPSGGEGLGGGTIRQLTVEQDHDWCPRVLPDGRVLYLRWEYADLPHAFSRILFHMNPDGTGQMEHYGSNSYWPASMFYARPMPGHPTKFAAIVGGHHDQPRMGDLVIFDYAKGRFEADGAVQRIPGHGRKVEPLLLDLPIAQSWPKFLHPYPLSEKYLLVSSKPAEGAPWGVYLADVFDNLVLLYEEPGYAMLEPIPLRKTPRPPVLPDRIDPARRDAEVFLTDVYAGPGLRGVPRGTIKALRLIGYQFAYQGVGGEPDSIGLDGPWDVRQILGTVPVHEDGSARFRVPAYTPVAVQPLDGEGKAVQLMRSWFTAMPGEVLSCVGCHETQNSAPPNSANLAAQLPPSEIRPWYGPARGFDFRREVQPVLDRHCVGCHDGKPRPDGRVIPDLTDRDPVPTLPNKNAYNLAARYTPSYYQVRKWVRTPTRESDLHLLPPWEFHADTTRLVQMLQKGHHNVQLDPEGWDRLVTWIDLNAPAHGTWTAICGSARVKHQWERRREMRKRYTGMEDDPEAVYPVSYGPPERAASGQWAVDSGQSKPEGPAPVPQHPTPTTQHLSSSSVPDNRQPIADNPIVAGWPFDAAEARRRQTAAGAAAKTVDLGAGLKLELVRIPGGEFIMGDAAGCSDEQPLTAVKVGEFWMGRFEVTNEQFARFDPAHDSRLEHGDYIQFSPGERGWTLSRPNQPVVRVSWAEAMAFCRWLSAKTRLGCTLPTEAQWEYACRAGTATPLWYGTLEADFSRFANVSDACHQAIDPFGWSGRTEVIPPWRPADTRFNDHSRVSAPAGSYAANPWGLHDLHGNVAEWTRSLYRPYPYREDDGRNAGIADCPLPTADWRTQSEIGNRKSEIAQRFVVRGGSWYDRPDRCRSAFRQTYLQDQGVYDVGFRVVCP